MPPTGFLPIPQPAPALHAVAAAHFLGQQLPGDAAPQNKENAGQDGTVGNPRPATLGFRRRRGQKRINQKSQVVGQESEATYQHHFADRETRGLAGAGRLDAPGASDTIKRT